MSYRDDILEECAKIAEDSWLGFSSPYDIAAAIRNLKLPTRDRKTKSASRRSVEDTGTPRTDAEVKLREQMPATNHGVSADFARELETELLYVTEWLSNKLVEDDLQRELDIAMESFESPIQGRKRAA